MQIILFIIILGVLIFIHELGHFLIAKLNGVQVDEFGFGYPPKALTLFKKNGTEYTLNWIPFGGFVRMRGETEEEDKSADKISGEMVDTKILINDGAEIAYAETREEIVTITPDEKSFLNKKPPQQIFIMFAGILFNWLLAWIIISITLIVGVSTIASGTPKYGTLSDVKDAITYVLPNSPADDAGLKPGDEITRLQFGKETLDDISNESMLEFVNRVGAEEINVFYGSGGEESQTTLIPEENIVSDKLAIGVSINEVATLKLPIHYAFVYGFNQTWQLTEAITLGFIDLFKNLFTGNMDELKSVSGPVGIVQAVGQASELGIVPLLTFIALISINLAILNLLPFPALDGGRILFTIIEWIKGSRIKAEIANLVNTIGFGILILLMIAITIKDIWNLF